MSSTQHTTRLLCIFFKLHGREVKWIEQEHFHSSRSTRASTTSTLVSGVNLRCAWKVFSFWDQVKHIINESWAPKRRFNLMHELSMTPRESREWSWNWNWKLPPYLNMHDFTTWVDIWYIMLKLMAVFVQRENITGLQNANAHNMYSQ